MSDYIKYNQSDLDWIRKQNKSDLDWIMKQKKEDLDWMMKMGEKKANTLAEQRKSELMSKREFNMPKLSSYNKDKSVLDRSKPNKLEKESEQNDIKDNKYNKTEKSDLFSLERVINEMKTMEAVHKAESIVKDTCHTNNDLSNVKIQSVDKGCVDVSIDKESDISGDGLPGSGEGSKLKIF